MSYHKEYLLFLVEFHGSRDYFECHEILEEYWKEVSPGNRESHWVGLIQIAVALYHYRRDNRDGALKTMRKARNLLYKKPEEIASLGMDHTKLIQLLDCTINRLKTGLPYESMLLPLVDSSLIEKCLTLCQIKNYSWNSPSDLHNDEVVHRHLLRDRSDIIEERNRQLKIRNITK
jgi:uncharacterized protein